VFNPALIGLAIALIGLAVAVLLRPVEKWGFRRIEPGHSSALLGVLLVVPSREGAAPSGKACLSGMAFAGLSWGLVELSKSHSQKKRKREPID
jgi:hypothetical protein